MNMNRLLGVAALALTALSGCLNPLVGAKCEDGYTACGGQCVDLASSAQNCGACGSRCDGVCSAGVCQPANAGGTTAVLRCPGARLR